MTRGEGNGETEFLADALAEAPERSARGIARDVGGMINDGRLTPGNRLPTVRHLADRLGVSPATISDAWQALRKAGLIDTAGRNGTTVLGPRQSSEGVGRYGKVAGIGDSLPINLATGTPDSGLLPGLDPIISAIDLSMSVMDYLAPPVVEELDTLLAATWPFEPEAMTVVNGSMDGLVRVASALVAFGDSVLVEDPTFPPLIDALERLGADLIPVEIDADGPRVDRVEEATSRRPVAFFFQPRAHNPTGVSLSEGRARSLAAVLDGMGTVVVENDHAGGIATAPPVSLGRYLPDRTVRILGFSKSHGPDLRLAAMAGVGAVIDAVAIDRVTGPGWTSRLLQRILVALLTDEPSKTAVAEARRVYADRREALVRALADRGVEVRCDDGLNLWLPVWDEKQALVTLAAHGIAAAPGSAFWVASPRTEHIRVTVGLVDVSDAESVAGVLAAAARLDAPVRRA